MSRTHIRNCNDVQELHIYNFKINYTMAENVLTALKIIVNEISNMESSAIHLSR